MKLIVRLRKVISDMNVVRGDGAPKDAPLEDEVER
jgi:hypothetical protein